MAKSKKTKKDAHKPSVKVQDLEPEKNPKGGAFAKLDSSVKLQGTSVPTAQLPGGAFYKEEWK